MDFATALLAQPTHPIQYDETGAALRAGGIHESLAAAGMVEVTRDGSITLEDPPGIEREEFEPATPCAKR